jgi:hypothetical protein
MHRRLNNDTCHVETIGIIYGMIDDVLSKFGEFTLKRNARYQLVPIPRD